MAVVPITKNSPPPSQAAPPEPALLMALAEMHKQGRFDKPLDINPIPHGSDKVGDRDRSSIQVSLSSSTQPASTSAMTGSGLY